MANLLCHRESGFAPHCKLIGPEPNDLNAYARSRHSSFSFWVQEQLHVGEMTGFGDCRDYVFFEENVDYLFILDAEGKALSAERIPDRNDPWLQAVLYAIETDGVSDMGEITFNEVFSNLQPLVDQATVYRCGRSPKILRTDLFTGKDEFETPRERFWFNEGDDPYIQYPFNRSSCKEGEAFLVLDYYQWFPIDSEGIVDLDGIALEKRAIGPSQISVQQIIDWLKEPTDL